METGVSTEIDDLAVSATRMMRMSTEYRRAERSLGPGPLWSHDPKRSRKDVYFVPGTLELRAPSGRHLSTSGMTAEGGAYWMERVCST